MFPATTNVVGVLSEGIVEFALDDMRCGIDLDATQEVLRAVAVRPVEGQPPFIAGVIDLRGTIVPVIDLRVRFGRTSRALDADDHFVIAKAHRRPIALWVDKVLGIIPASSAGIRSIEGLIVGTRSLRGVTRTTGGIVLVHDVAGFISEAELDALEHAQHQ
ncbi:MAG: chemotaxis protein CheW [Vulcanimicrobiaceae bacterium]